MTAKFSQFIFFLEAFFESESRKLAIIMLADALLLLLEGDEESSSRAAAAVANTKKKALQIGRKHGGGRTDGCSRTSKENYTV
jgi:hypothetical protein